MHFLQKTYWLFHFC